MDKRNQEFRSDRPFSWPVLVYLQVRSPNHRTSHDTYPHCDAGLKNGRPTPLRELTYQSRAIRELIFS